MIDPPKDYAEGDGVEDHGSIVKALDTTAVQLGMTDRYERKAIIKEALAEAAKEWLDDRYRQVGKWSVRGISAAAFAALVYFVLTHTGWVKP